MASPFPSPSDIRSFTLDQLQELADDIRAYLTRLQPGKQGHLESSLGVVELTIALHASFETPQDILIWDVGHQAYVHKLLTGRFDQLKEMRKRHGISGFPKRDESDYDAFGTGHSSTSISALGGMAHADRLKGNRRKYVAVIGDGAITGGQAFEALNHLIDLDLDLLIVFNDNGRSLDPNVGALHHHHSYSDFFGSLQWQYSGPVDGNHLPSLLPALKNAYEQTGTRILHVQSRHPALARSHGSLVPRTQGEMSFSEVFGRSMHEMLEEGREICVVSPAMIESAYLGDLRRRFPERVIDTGITEQHAVTFAAGLAAGGQHVFCHLYSTFSQRAVDQIIHDVALQNLPVTFVLDRAGITGEDGPTHHGVFDLGLFRPIPNLHIWDASDGDRLRHLLKSESGIQHPRIIRIPRAKTQLGVNERSLMLPVDIIRGKGTRGRIVLGHMLTQAQNSPFDGPMAVVHHVKPLSIDILQSFLQGLKEVEVWEDASIHGGLYELLCSSFQMLGVRFIPKGVPDHFVPHGKIDELWKEILHLKEV